MYIGWPFFLLHIWTLEFGNEIHNVCFYNKPSIILKQSRQLFSLIYVMTWGNVPFNLYLLSRLTTVKSTMITCGETCMLKGKRWPKRTLLIAVKWWILSNFLNLTFCKLLARWHVKPAWSSYGKTLNWLCKKNKVIKLCKTFPSILKRMCKLVTAHLIWI